MLGPWSLAKAGNTPLQHGTVVGLGEHFITMVVWCSGGAWEFSTGSGGMVQCWGLGVWQRRETRLCSMALWWGLVNILSPWLCGAAVGQWHDSAADRWAWECFTDMAVW